MAASFHVDAGPFVIDVRLDDCGIRMERRFNVSRVETIPWERITGATLVPPGKSAPEDARKEEQMARFLGPETVQKYRELQGKVGQIVVAYRDSRNSLRQTEVPALLTDAAYLLEFQSRLGKRWLGETRDRQQVAKRLHTNVGFLKGAFILITFSGIAAVVVAVLALGVIGPILNFLSIQRILLDLQDGEYVSLAWRIVCYLMLFVIAFFLHRVVRIRLDATKGPRDPLSAFGARRSDLRKLLKR